VKTVRKIAEIYGRRPRKQSSAEPWEGQGEVSVREPVQEGGVV
jgi:hypothetical protein